MLGKDITIYTLEKELTQKSELIYMDFPTEFLTGGDWIRMDFTQYETLDNIDFLISIPSGSTLSGTNRLLTGFYSWSKTNRYVILKPELFMEKYPNFLEHNPKLETFRYRITYKEKGEEK